GEGRPLAAGHLQESLLRGRGGATPHGAGVRPAVGRRIAGRGAERVRNGSGPRRGAERPDRRGDGRVRCPLARRGGTGRVPEPAPRRGEAEQDVRRNRILRGGGREEEPPGRQTAQHTPRGTQKPGDRSRPEVTGV